MIETGGTIDMRGSFARSPEGAVDGLVDKIRHFTKNVKRHRPLELQLDSTNVGPREWSRIAQSVETIVAEKEGRLVRLGVHV